MSFDMGEYYGEAGALDDDLEYGVWEEDRSLSDDDFDYDSLLAHLEKSRMAQYGMIYDKTGEGTILSFANIGIGLTKLARAVDTTEMAYIEFEASGKKLCDVSALKSFIHLRIIDLSDNNLKSVLALSSLRFLQVLNLRGNSIESLDKVPKCPWLQALNLSKNKLKSIEGGFLEENLIEYLNLSYNEISMSGENLFTSKFFPNLVSLELRNNNLSSIAGMDLPKLEKLYIVAQNKLKDILGVEGCPSLKTLHARDNKITKLTFLETMPHLNYINLRENNIRHFTQTAHLEKCTSLYILILIDNPIKQSYLYEKEIVAACLTLTRLDQMILSTSDIIEGRILRTGRENGTIESVVDDLTLKGRDSDDEFVEPE